MKKILITGSNGLLGQKLVYKLRNNTDITCIATARGANRLVKTDGYVFEALDITNLQNVNDVFLKHKPDVIINTAAIIEHDCNLEDFVHVSPSATLSGNVSVGTGTLIGTGAIVIPNIKIGNWCTIGAGAVIIDDVPDGATVIGNPAKIIKYNYYSELDSI